jgi:hypothetical protein
MSLINRDVYWRNCEVVELDSGRPQGWNPRLVQSVTVFREYDPTPSLSLGNNSNPLHLVRSHGEKNFLGLITSCARKVIFFLA